MMIGYVMPERTVNALVADAATLQPGATVAAVPTMTSGELAAWGVGGLAIGGALGYLSAHVTGVRQWVLTAAGVAGALLTPAVMGIGMGVGAVAGSVAARRRKANPGRRRGRRRRRARR